MSRVEAGALRDPDAFSKPFPKSLSKSVSFSYVQSGYASQPNKL